jgi:hypothetical protein
MSNVVTPTASFVRPANITAYASGQLVANSTTAGSVVPMTFAIRNENIGSTIRRVRMRKSSTGVSGSSFRVHLYNQAPTVTNGDGGVWLSTTSGYVGSFDVTIDKAFSDGAGGAGVVNNGVDMIAMFGTMYGLVEARGAYTPVSGETITVELEVLCDPMD